MNSSRHPSVIANKHPVNLLDLPGIGPFLRWHYARPVMQSMMLLVVAFMLFDGLFGPQVAYKNLATVTIWIHYRGFLMLALLIFGNFFCMACPFMLPRKVAKQLQNRFGWGRGWPSWLPQKAIAIALLVLYFYSYEAFNLWTTPWWTAFVVLGYFGVAFFIDFFFKGAAFCKHICPVGQFNMVYGTISPTEISVIEPTLCSSCITKDCIAGSPPAPNKKNIPGCELHLFQPKKIGNLDCTFCLDCVHACPYENVGLQIRMPGVELISNVRRSGIGKISEREDLAFLIIVLSFGAFMQAFGMIPPVYELEVWLARQLGVTSEAALLAIIFFMGVVALPLALVYTAAWLSRMSSSSVLSIRKTISRFAPSIIPLGAGMWAAHYTFHFCTGFLAIIPTIQSFVADSAGQPLFGKPRWELATILSFNQIILIESIFLYAGLIGSLLVAWLIALQLHTTRRRAIAGWYPWAMLFVLLLGSGLWIMLNPMQMRGTIYFTKQ